MTMLALLSFANIDLEVTFLGNTLLSYAQAVGVFVLLSIIFKFVQFLVLHKLAKLAEKTKTDIDDTFIKIVRSLKPSFYYFVAFYFAIKFLIFTPLASQIINGILIAWIVYQVIIAVQILIDYVLEKKLAKKEEDANTKAALKYVSNIAKAALWVLGVLLILSNLGINITSIVAGLGIGGIAIAFALQNILGDLFSSFAIYFDKPFKVGDFIIVGDHLGTVEKIGIKTTRIKALQGEEVIISNQELTSTRVQNMKRMKERRIAFSFGVLYETPVKKVKKIPEMVTQIIGGIGMARLDRAHFKSFDDSALGFDVVYYVKKPDYNTYMDVQQEINVKLMEVFEKEGIAFAYPTQTLYIQK